MLIVQDLQAGYGASSVLRGVDLQVAPGEIVALLGRNGSGRSTLARCLAGMLPWRGSVRWHGAELRGLAPFRVARAGVAWVPETRDVFPRLTVAENLRLGLPAVRRDPSGARPLPSVDAMLARLPSLQARARTPAGVLSGGEQQMLALARALMSGPGLLVVAEPTEGLSPQWVAEVSAWLRELRAQGLAILLIEQRLSIALALADRVALMGQGRVVFDGPVQALQHDEALRRSWLEI